MTEHNYYMKTPNVAKLHEWGFRFIPLQSTNDSRIYIYTFPLLKYRFTTLLECNIIVDSLSGEVAFNVYTQEGRPYAAFYHQDSNNDVVDMIDKKLKNKFRKFGIKKERTHGRKQGN